MKRAIFAAAVAILYTAAVAFFLIVALSDPLNRSAAATPATHPSEAA